MESKENKERNEPLEANVEYSEEQMREKSAILEQEISGLERLAKLLE